MKYLGPLLAGGLTLVVVLVVGVFSFWPAIPSPQPTAKIPVAQESPPPEQIVIASVDASELEATMAEREAVYRAQLEELRLALPERQATYQVQIQDLTTQITAAQQQLNELKDQNQSLPAQIAQLEQTRTERQATYQAQLQKLQNQYNDRISQLQAQLNEAQIRLAEARTQLGR